MFVAPSRAGNLRALWRAPHCVSLTCATACIVLTAPVLSFAQTASDPITGAWSGRLGRSAVPSYPVSLSLKLDGTSVSGTVSTADGNGEVSIGAYDTASSTLHLEVRRVGESSASLVFDGVVVHGLATGRVLSAQGTGTFVLTLDGTSLSAPQANLATISRDVLRSAVEELMSNITRAAAIVPAQRFRWRPVGTVRSVAELLGHIVDASLYFCGRATGHSVQWTDANAQVSLDKQVLIAKLNDVAAQCNAAAGSGTLEMLVANYGHASLHYGNLVTYLRLLGHVPPAGR
ncbi:DinB family protein [Pseudogemmatithrix spongiicola]|uniref:DinB family protein n=1 Tax=Pseudogemmatithrix spongiicola TaxID=3062599 RepID=A0AA49Q847_9BACT|nr:DinB family protein [Gemmatimonadaceae bacterium 'strain 138']WKW16438.1 DinB family protein [Gemmatimonadaceae bacterium 'strain 318']